MLQCVLHLRRVYVETADDDLFLDSSGYVDDAIVQPTYISGREPSFGIYRDYGTPNELARHRFGTHENLALAVSNVIALNRPDFDLHTASGPSDRAGTPPASQHVLQPLLRHGANLSHPIGLHHRYSEA